MSALLRFCCIMLLSIWASAPASAKDESAGSKLKEVEALFAAGDFESASRGVNDLLIRDQSLSSEAQARVPRPP